MSAVTQSPYGRDVDFRRLLEALPLAAYTCDAQGLITSYNQFAVQAWGREPRLNDPQDRYCGSFRMSTIAGEWVPHDQCWMARCLHERRAFEGEEIVVERPDGTRLVVLAHAVPMFDEHETLIGAVNVIVDITGRKQTEQKLQESENALREASRRKDEFLAMLAHELRNPLAPIRNALKMLRLAKDDADLATIERMHHTLERQVHHLIHLVDDLMDVSRITRDRFELRREMLEFAAVVDLAVESARPAIDAANHQLTVTVPGEPLLLDGDPVRLTQVLANLLNNAAKYTEVGGEIYLTVGRDGAEVFASVRDTGVGLAPELLPRVFDSFAQLDGTHYRKQGGLGIGLTLVKRLVEMHGGRVEARSAGPGRGSEFIVRLPLAVAARTPEAAPANNPPAFAQQRILVVDDNHDAAVTLALLLQVYGAEVIVAHDGITALDVLKSSRPSVLLLDIGMPGMDGYELARRARQLEGEALTIIAVTGWGQAKDRSLSKAAGIDHHLVKPIDCEALVALLKDADRPR